MISIFHEPSSYTLKKNDCETYSRVHYFDIWMNIIIVGKLGWAAWIGAHKHFGDWQYDGIAKGLMGQITDWKSGEPNWESEKCVSTDWNGKWNNLACDWKKNYVCEMRMI